MKSFAIAATLAVGAVATDFKCPKPNGNFCSGESLETGTIVRCHGGKPTTASCADNLTGVNPVGPKSGAICWQTSFTSGNAACAWNSFVYPDEGGKFKIDKNGNKEDCPENEAPPRTVPCEDYECKNKKTTVKIVKAAPKPAPKPKPKPKPKAPQHPAPKEDCHGECEVIHTKTIITSPIEGPKPAPKPHPSPVSSPYPVGNGTCNGDINVCNNVLNVYVPGSPGHPTPQKPGEAAKPQHPAPAAPQHPAPASPPAAPQSPGSVEIKPIPQANPVNVGASPASPVSPSSPDSGAGPAAPVSPASNYGQTAPISPGSGSAAPPYPLSPESPGALPPYPTTTGGLNATYGLNATAPFVGAATANTVSGFVVIAAAALAAFAML
ncbi:MAG: hypothetical protein M1825_002678 [Sarcosagium campestre]|nr:MAG: hypothetical protein M1825_002678 [Sarcosagium campestre]